MPFAVWLPALLAAVLVARGGEVTMPTLQLPRRRGIELQEDGHIEPVAQQSGDTARGNPRSHSLPRNAEAYGRRAYGQ